MRHLSAGDSVDHDGPTACEDERERADTLGDAGGQEWWERLRCTRLWTRLPSERIPSRFH